ncbi:MAG: hypothetical protein ACOC7S_00720 [Planctomycetota bacterium]
MTDPRRYEIRHRHSRFRGRVVEVLIRPSPKRRPNNVLCRDVDTGDMADRGVSVTVFVAVEKALREIHGPRYFTMPGIERLRRHLAEAERIYRDELEPIEEDADGTDQE